MYSRTCLKPCNRFRMAAQSQMSLHRVPLQRPERILLLPSQHHWHQKRGRACAVAARGLQRRWLITTTTSMLTRLTIVTTVLLARLRTANQASPTPLQALTRASTMTPSQPRCQALIRASITATSQTRCRALTRASITATSQALPALAQAATTTTITITIIQTRPLLALLQAITTTRQAHHRRLAARQARARAPARVTR